MAIQKLNSKNQIVLPKEARQAMGVKGGEKLLLFVKNDLTIVMLNPKRYAQILRSLTKGTYSRLSQTRRQSMVNKPPSKDLPSEPEQIGIDTNLFIYFLEDHSR